MKHGATMSLEEQIHYILNRPHNPKNDKIPPGWEDEEMSHDLFMETMDMAIAYRKEHGLIPNK